MKAWHLYLNSTLHTHKLSNLSITPKDKTLHGHASCDRVGCPPITKQKTSTNTSATQVHHNGCCCWQGHALIPRAALACHLYAAQVATRRWYSQVVHHRDQGAIENTPTWSHALCWNSPKFLLKSSCSRVARMLKSLHQSCNLLCNHHNCCIWRIPLGSNGDFAPDCNMTLIPRYNPPWREAARGWLICNSSNRRTLQDISDSWQAKSRLFSLTKVTFSDRGWPPVF